METVTPLSAAATSMFYRVTAEFDARLARMPRLKASTRGTARGERQIGDIYLIRERDVRRFVLEHPSEIDLRKVDQLWFLDRLTNGLARTA